MFNGNFDSLVTMLYFQIMRDFGSFGMKHVKEVSYMVEPELVLSDGFVLWNWNTIYLTHYTM